MLNIDLEIPVLEHGGALGAAMLAAKSSLDADEYQATEEEFYKIKETVTPDKSLVDFYNEKYKKYLGIYPAVRTAMQ